VTAVTVSDMRALTAAAVFDVQDRWARDRGVLGPRPRPSGPLRFTAAATIDGGGRHEIDPPQELVTRRNGSGYHIFFGVMGDGRRLDAGTYAIRIEGPLYQTAEREDVTVPQPGAPYTYDLEPGYAYPFPPGSTLLRGSVHDTGGDGLAGVRVSVPGVSNEYVTDATGQWALVFDDTQPTGDVTVRFELPGDPPIDLAAVAVLARRESLLTQTGLRGNVRRGRHRPRRRLALRVPARPGAGERDGRRAPPERHSALTPERRAPAAGGRGRPHLQVRLSGQEEQSCPST
jgi:hypothetical protein